MWSYSLPSENYDKARYVLIIMAILVMTLSLFVVSILPSTIPSVVLKQTELTLSSHRNAAPTSGALDIGSLMKLNDAVEPSGRTKLSVNGQNIPVPDNGSVQKTVKGNSDNSRVDISIDSTSSGASEVHSSSSLNLNFHSTTEITTDNTE